MSINLSYAITVCDEHEELKNLLSQLITYIDIEDEIVIQIDQSNHTELVLQTIRDIIAAFPANQINLLMFPLNKDFATYKNNLKNNCTKDFIFFIDADELLSEDLLLNFKQVLEMNPTIDCYNFPRVNTVSGLTQDHIIKWGWRVNEKGWINFPDKQKRVCRNTQTIQWQNKVHETLVGWTNIADLPDDEIWAIIHNKTIEKQEKQNALYQTI